MTDTPPFPPTLLAAHQARALAAVLAGRVSEALDSLREAIELTIAVRGDVEAAARTLAVVDLALARRPEATVAAPAIGVLYRALGMAALGAGCGEAAVACGEAAAARRPDDAEARYLAGVALTQAGRREDAVGHLARAVELAPAVAAHHLSLAEALLPLGRQPEAVAACRTAVALDPTSAATRFHLGVALAAGGPEQREAALASYREAVRLDPGLAEAHYNLGMALSADGQFAAAVDALDKARASRSLALVATFARGVCLLKLGHLRQGFRDYEARACRANAPDPALGIPEWTGASLAGRTILVRSEQGLGDSIQFVRYAALLKAQGARVVLACPPSLVPLLSTAPGVDLAMPWDQPVPAGIDCWLPLMSLPWRCGTELDSIPATVPYLAAEPDRVARWAAWLRERPGFRVGLAWQGHPTAAIDAGRSIPLAALAPLAGVPGVRLIALQKHHGLDQLDGLPAGLAVDQPGAGFDDGPGAFRDSAALLGGLDLLVTSDTAMAHLAGALGRRAWVLLKADADWRWLLDRSDSPWYPTMTLYRQRQPGDWADVAARVAADLAAATQT